MVRPPQQKVPKPKKSKGGAIMPLPNLPWSTRVQAPVSRALKTGTGRPTINGKGNYMVKHTEYIADISGSVGFSATAFSVNPGLGPVFPWLSRIAKNYESYRFKKLHFRFETEQSTASNGTIMGAMEYDAADAAPTTKQQLMSYAGAVRSPLWDSFCYDCNDVDMKKLGAQKFVRTAALASNLDIKTYDLGTFYVCTQGCADTSLIGELYVDYEIELETPQFEGLTLYSQSYVTPAGTGTDPFGSSAGASYGDGIIERTSGTTATFLLGGQFLILHSSDSSSVTALATPTVDVGSLSVKSTCINAANSFAKSFIVNVAPGAVLTYGSSTGNIGNSGTFRIASYTYANA